MWVLDEQHVHYYSSDGRYIKGFRNLVGATSMTILPNGGVALAGRPIPNHGSITVYSPDGEFLYSFSEKIRIPGYDNNTWYYSDSKIECYNDTIWQIYAYLNIIKIYSISGIHIKDISIDDELIWGMHEYNIAAIKNNDIRGPFHMFYGLKSNLGCLWVYGSPSRSLEGDRRNSPTKNKYIIAIDDSGNINSSYIMSPHRVPHDVVINQLLPINILYIDILNEEIVWSR